MALHANVPQSFLRGSFERGAGHWKSTGILKGVGPNHVVVSFMLSFSTFKSVYFQFFVPILK